MCTGSGPSPAAAVPEAPVTPTQDPTVAGSNRDKRRLASSSQTLLTGSSGVGAPSGAVQRKQLLGA